MTDATVTNIRSTEGLSATEVLERIPGLTYRQLDFWTRTERIKALPGPKGSGNYRRYSEDQVAIAGRMYRLLVYGFNFNVAEQLAKSREIVEDAINMLRQIYTEMLTEQINKQIHQHATGSEQDYRARPDGEGA